MPAAAAPAASRQRSERMAHQGAQLQLISDDVVVGALARDEVGGEARQPALVDGGGSVRGHRGCSFVQQRGASAEGCAERPLEI